ncbi:MAG: PrsW family glutamic-type intramembrane protease [Minisyncoccia bacterium]
MIDFQTIFWALVGGFIPAILWLMFWLREDARNPESNFLILKTFLAGSAVVILVIPFQKIVADTFPGLGVATFTLWAILEEAFKFLAAYFIAIRTKADDDEAIDPMIFMITAALGFVALENALFILNPLVQKDIMNGLLMGNMRFIGASLLHVISSATIGLAISLHFYKPLLDKIIWGFLAFVLAVSFHTVFNLFIVDQNDLGTFVTFGVVWAGIVVLLLLFEKVKSIKLQKSS